MIKKKDKIRNLIAQLKNKDFVVRCNAATDLSEIADKSAIPALIKTLKDKDALVRRNAVWALGVLGNKQAVPALIKVLGDTERNILGYGYVVEAAISVLGEIGDEKAVPALVQALQSGWLEEAVEALKKIKFRKSLKIQQKEKG